MLPPPRMMEYIDLCEAQPLTADASKEALVRLCWKAATEDGGAPPPSPPPHTHTPHTHTRPALPLTHSVARSCLSACPYLLLAQPS
jgi:hypothetical protein